MKLMEQPGYETIIGDGRHLTDYMENLIKQGKITRSQAFSIKDRLKNNLEKGYIKEERLILKAHEMLSDFYFEFEWFLKNVLANNEICPICLEKMDYREGICQNCAFDINMVDLDCEDFENMHKFSDFVESQENIRKIKNKYLKDDVHEENLWVDLLFEIFLDDDSRREYNQLNLNDWVDIEKMYGYFDEDVESDYVFEEEIPETEQPVQITEIEFCKMDDNRHRLTPRMDDSYVMPVRLKQFEYYKSVEMYNDADLALHDLSFVPWHFRQRLRDSSFEEGFLTHHACKGNWKDFSKDLKAGQLKEFLERHGMDNSGTKKELIKKIAKSDLPIEEFSCEKTFLSQKAYDFLKEYEWVQFYLDNMYQFDFLDFEDYLIAHEGSFFEKTLDYLDEHIKLAEESFDFKYIIESYNAKTKILHATGNLQDALNCDMKILHLNMNPICLDSLYYSFHIPLEPENISNLKEDKSKFGEGLILDAFNENWNFLGFMSTIIPKDDVWKYLITALNANEENFGSRKVREKYFMNF